ncbi:hypothetical protein SSS_03876 [Sarcoptes scabiei]|nr:hypothetical protein SSS_03876 [Sarcoptes scabiei]
MDEDLDPELMNEDLSSISQFPLNKKDNSIKDSNSNKIEKCRYWPSCLNGHCEFYHPTIKCNLFPHCRFGEKCLYIHPICKFDSLCARKDCPFTHSNSKRVFINHTINSSNNIIICKYFPKCVNPGCEFLHPKICHFGSTCKTLNCPFIHTNLNNLPHPSQLKWSSHKNRA